MRPHSIAVAPLVTATLVAALALTGCSSSGGGKPSTSSSSVASSSVASSSSAAPSSSASESITPAQISAVLLTASDISATATASAETPTDTSLPCAVPGSLSLNQQVPASARAGVDIADNTLKAALSEEIRVYPDVATAQHAQSIAKAGLSCADGTLTASDGTRLSVKITGPQDIVTALKADTKLASVPIGSALEWSATSAQNTFVLVVVQIDRTLVLLSFVATPSTDLTKLPTPVAVVQKAIEKGN